MGGDQEQLLGARAPERGAANDRTVSRRRLIRNAGIAGAAAWTAPVILDSVSKAALAVAPSGCAGDKYYLKLVGRGSGTSLPAGACYYASPLCNSGSQSLTFNNSPTGNQQNCSNGYTWVCLSGNVMGPRAPQSFVNSNPSNDAIGTYTVTLAAGCTFSGTTNYNAVGNYNWTGSGGNCAGTGQSAVTVGTNTAVFQKGLSGYGVLDYMYMEFVCV